MLDSLTSVKKLSLALGVAGVSALVGLPALAQAPNMTNGSQYFRESQEIMMSNEGMEILCRVTPINSRCEGSPYYTGTSTAAPEDTAPGETPETSPSGTTAPTQDLPSETDETAPAGGMAPGGMAPGGMMNNEPSSGSGGTMTPPSSDGTMAPPSGTTAPTENLPSESPGK